MTILNLHNQILFILLISLNIILIGHVLLLWATKIRTRLIFSQLIYFITELFVFTLILISISPAICNLPILSYLYIHNNNIIFILRIIRLLSLGYCIYHYGKRLNTI